MSDSAPKAATRLPKCPRYCGTMMNRFSTIIGTEITKDITKRRLTLRQVSEYFFSNTFIFWNCTR